MFALAYARCFNYASSQNSYSTYRLRKLQQQRSSVCWYFLRIQYSEVQHAIWLGIGTLQFRHY